MYFKLRGTQVAVSPVLLAALGLFLLWDRTGLGGQMVLAAALHELGHLLVMAAWGEAPAELSFHCFGVRITRAGGRLLPWGREALLYAAGPAVNLLFAAAAWGWGRPGTAAVHLVLGVFNLLPAGALDGGRLLALLLDRRLSPGASRRAQRVLCALTAAGLLSAAFFAGSGPGRASLTVTTLYLLWTGWRE